MDELRIVLLGKQGAGKSASGNTLLRMQSFHTAASSKRVTQACSMSASTVDKQTIKVIDTPGWCDSSRFENGIKQEIIKCISMSSPGPHAFLLVLPIGRFTTEEINTVMNILKEFGDEVTKYMIVLFTKGDDLEGRPIEDYLKELHSNLKMIIQLCGERYHVFNNRDKTNYDQVSSLLKKVNKMVERNEKQCYTTAMYQKVNDQQTDNRRHQQCRRKDYSVQDKSKNLSGSHNGGRRNRGDAEKVASEKVGTSEVRMEHLKEKMTQQQVSTQNREHELLKDKVTPERESNNREEQRRRENSGKDDKRGRRYSYDDDARRRNMEEKGEVSREVVTQEQLINKYIPIKKEKEALEFKRSKERVSEDQMINYMHDLQEELKEKDNYIQELQRDLNKKDNYIQELQRDLNKKEIKLIEQKSELKTNHNELLKQQVDEQKEMFKRMENVLAQQKTTDDNEKKMKKIKYVPFFRIFLGNTSGNLK